MNSEYHTSISQKTWTVESGDPTRTITCGFWIKETVDRPFGPAEEVCGIKAYPYRPLSNARNIRLLCLQPDTGFGPLRGSLVETQANRFALNGSSIMGFKDTYEALSYTWGDATNATTMMLDGIEFGIRSSLEAALLHIRSTNSEKVLWIDAICINQHDNHERSIQVAQMLQVYAAAKRVHVWLGLSSKDSKVGMMVFQQLCDNRRINGDPLWRSLLPDMIRGGIEDIISRPWFYRMWVIQEAAVANEVIMHCGQHQFAWYNTAEQVRFFSRSIKMAITRAAWEETCLKGVNVDPFLQVLQRQLDNGPESADYKANLPALDLLDIAYESRTRSTVEPRDYIYAILGFADRETRRKIEPDYNVSAEDLFNWFEGILLYGLADQPNESEGTAEKPSTSSHTRVFSEPRAEPWSHFEGPWQVIDKHDSDIEHICLSANADRKPLGNTIRATMSSNRKKLQRLWP